MSAMPRKRRLAVRTSSVAMGHKRSSPLPPYAPCVISRAPRGSSSPTGADVDRISQGVGMSAPLADWANFFVAEVGASAALAGLVVVAISINLSRILSFPQLPARAAESLLMLTGALMLASFGLMPGQAIAVLGAEILAIGVATLSISLYNQLQSLPSIE